MTELNVTESPRKKTGIGRMKKANLRIDMTPMVDLGFLLIAFLFSPLKFQSQQLQNYTCLKKEKLKETIWLS